MRIFENLDEAGENCNDDDDLATPYLIQIYHQRCDGKNDCPLTETSAGGEDEENCEGSGQVMMMMSLWRKGNQPLVFNIFI